MEINNGVKPSDQEEAATALPSGTKYSLIVPLDDKGNKATFHISEMKEDVFVAAQKMIENGKDFDAIRMCIKALRTGGDEPVLLENNFIAMQSAAGLFRQILAPIPGELKKN